MRYRATLKGVDPAAKTEQAFAESKAEIRRWATATLEAVQTKWKPTATVVIEEQVWTLVESLK